MLIFGVLSFHQFRLCHLNVLLHFKMSSHQTNKDKPDLQSAITSVSLLTLITIAPHAGNLARVMTPVSRSNLFVVFVLPYQKSC